MALNKINEFHDLPEGKRLCILSSGPSLSALDLTPLRRRLVMGLNRSAILFPDTHYPCTMDARIFTEFPDMLKKTRYLFSFEERPFGIPLKLLGVEGFIATV